MNRIDVVYGGRPYTVGGRTLESLQDVIAQAAASGAPYWLKVRAGEGRVEDAFLLIAPGIPIAVIDVTSNSPADTAAGGEHDHDHDETFALDVL
jgi:hypothetical protein